MTNRFVWAELVTTEQSKTSEFYRSLFQWTAEEMDMGEAGTYLMMKAGEAAAGGIAQSPMEVPSHWMSYLTVDDVDADAGRVSALGGQVVAEPFDIPGIGRAAIALDPNGASFALFAPADAENTPDGEPSLHTVCWREVVADDPKKAAAFYEQLVGWTTEPMGEDVLLFKDGDAMVGTVRKTPAQAEGGPSHWMHYFLVDDVDESAAKAQKLGAQLFMPGTDVPNMGRFAVLADPTGGTFALWKNAGAGQR